MENERLNVMLLVYIAIAFLTIVFFSVVMLAKVTDIYNFTTPETQKQYETVEGYKVYSNSDIGLSFLYPSDWEIKNVGEISIEIVDPDSSKGYNNYIKIFKTNEDNIDVPDENFNIFTRWFKRETVSSRSGEYNNTLIRQYKKINGIGTIQEYSYHYPDGLEEEKEYNLKYYVLLKGKDIIVVDIDVDDKEEFEVIAGSMKY